MKYIVADFYENPFGDAVYVADSEQDAKKFCDVYAEETGGECALRIIPENM